MGPMMVSDQKQRRLSGAAAGLVEAADLPLASEDRVVRPVVVDKLYKVRLGAW
jgi:hypothetical protein